MVNSTDVYTGVSANFDNKCISIIEYLLSKRGEPYTYVEVAKHVNLPTAEVSRYLRPECFERRDWDWLMKMRKYKKTAYNHYLNNHQIRVRTADDGTPVLKEDGTPIKELYVNFSKHTIFLMNCRLRNVQVLYQKHGEKRLVHLFENQENERTKIYYEVPTSPWEALQSESKGESVAEGAYEEPTSTDDTWQDPGEYAGASHRAVLLMDD